MRICISSDSTCDLTLEYIAEHKVKLLPLYTMMGGRTYRDGVDIHPSDIFAHVAGGGELCATAANNVADYYGFFTALLQDYEAVIHINISADFSSCYQNACTAAESLENVFIIDSRNLSTGHGHIVVEAVKMAEAGVLTPEEIVAQLKDLAGRVDASFILDRLDYMRKGGRCSMVEALGANLLKLKPCILVKEGKMEVGRKFRGSFKKCLQGYVADRLQGRDDLVLERIFITHTPVDDGIVDFVRDEILKYAPFTEIVETEAGCTVSCHCGPGTLGILFIRSKQANCPCASIDNSWYFSYTYCIN